MGMLRKKKKREKKPWTIERFTRIFLPIIFIGIVIFSITGGGFACDNPFGATATMLEELRQPFDVNTIIGDDIVLSSDKQTLKEKLGPNGADLNIILDGEIRAELYNDQVTLTALDDIVLSTHELAQFCNILWQNSDLIIEVMEIKFVEKNDMYNLDMVYKIDLSNLTKDLTNGLNEIKVVYIRSSNEIVLENNGIKIVGSVSQANALSTDSNTEIFNLIKILVNKDNDPGCSMYVDVICSFATKLSANIVIKDNKFTFAV